MAIISTIIDQIGAAEFDEALLIAANKIMPVDEISGYLLDAEKNNPLAAGWCGKRADTAVRVDQYINEKFVYDPAIKKLPESTSTEDKFYRLLHGRSVENSGYRWTFFDKPGFHSEITVIQKTNSGWTLIKFHFKAEHINNTLVRQIGELGAFLFPVTQRHTLYADGSYNQEARPMTQEKLVMRLGKRFPELTLRERQVCALTILGSSTRQVADALNITSSTVMTYRRRAYGRLGINNANALVREII